MGLFRRRVKAEPPEAEEPEALGWAAIDAALARVHGEVEPEHRALMPGVAFGSPLQGISAYPAADHWHYVTYGLSDIFGEPANGDAISGFGYELSMRVPRAAGQPAPDWPFRLLAKVADAARSGSDFASGDRLQVGGPITGQPDCVMQAVAFATDPSLPTWIESPCGSFEVYQLVGVTPQELSEMQATTTEAVIARLAADGQSLITDPTRT